VSLSVDGDGDHAGSLEAVSAKPIPVAAMSADMVPLI